VVSTQSTTRYSRIIFFFFFFFGGANSSGEYGIIILINLNDALICDIYYEL
jgi:hypothetical protein